MRPVAVITGASSGIGETFARQLADRGYDLILVARRKDKLETLSAEFRTKHGIGAVALAADLTTDEGLRIVEQAILEDPEFELLINNAGFGSMGYFADTTIESQDQMHRLHVLATMRLSHAALRALVPKNRGGIINVSSVAAFWQSPQNVSYCATKAWINSFTEGMALELSVKESAITVQALCPGFTYSEFHDTLGMSRDGIPKSLWLDSGDVVSESLRSFDSGKLIVVPGFRYKVLVAILRILPRWIRWPLARKQGSMRKPVSKS